MNDPLLLLGNALLVFAILFLFLDFKISLVLFMISFGLILLYWQTPQGKAAIARAKAQQLAIAELKKTLEERTKQLSISPSDGELLDSILKSLETLSKDDLQSLIYSVIIPLLNIKPLDEHVRDSALSFAKKAITRTTPGNETSSKSFYDAALDILQKHPDHIPLKKYALDVGRWQCSISRTDGKVTIYDEQAIQNDILVRSQQ